jgi:Acyltransferase
MTPASLMGSLLVGVTRLITGTQGHWKGCPPKAEQRIYFANHQSHFDWVLIWAALPHELRAVTRPIAARDYWTAGRFKRWLTSEVFHAVYVSRQRSDEQDPLEPLAEALAHGDSLVIFPESFPQVQLIPAWIDNVQRVMPKGEVVPVPILCTVTFGAPLPRIDGEDKQAFLERARQAVVELRPVHR